MVLEQKMSAMQEHNTPGLSSEAQSAHSKKMSLATKLKNKRRSRQSGSRSPVPNNNTSNDNEGPLQMAASASKSPVRDTSTVASSSSITAGPTPTTSGSNSARSNEAAASSTSTTNTTSSMGASLLHNKRRAMLLAKTRRTQDQQQKEPSAAAARSPVKPAAMATTKNTAKGGGEDVNDNLTSSKAAPASSSSKRAGKPSAYFRKMAASRIGFTEPKPAPAASDTTASLASHSNDQDVTPAPSAESEESQQTHYSKASTTNTSIPKLTAHSIGSNSHQDAVVPWETTEEPVEPAPVKKKAVVAVPSGSVVSNGVVDYDESIMSLARLDNFRSKANQTKAAQNNESRYPGSSSSVSASAAAASVAAPDQTSSETTTDSHHHQESGDTIPSSAAKAAKWNSAGAQKTAPVQKAAWRTRSPSPALVNSEELEQSQSSVTSSSTTKVHAAKFSRQPSWKKSPVRNSVQQQDDCPLSPTPSTTSAATSQPVSPARSTYSTASYRHERPSSPFLMMPKFSSSRSDVGVANTLPMPSVYTAATTKSWKASPVVKKSTFAPPRQEDACPVSPSTSQVSEMEPAESVPKAKAWSAKKQTPAWAKRSSSPGALPPQPQHEPLQKATASPAPKPRHYSPSPSIPKPVATTRQIPSVEDAEKEPTTQSPRRHSSPAPSWAKSPKEVHDDTKPQEELSPPVPTTKSWAVNKQAPAWMKKAQGAEGPAEKPPASVPTTKTWSAKKQTPAWMKKAASSENDQAPTASPRRSSTPSWRMPGQANGAERRETLASPQASKEKLVVASSPQTPAWKKPSPAPATDAGRPPSPAPNSSSKSWKARNSSVAEQTVSPSPRSQSWKPTSPPLSVEKSTVGGSALRKARHSIGGEPPKALSAAGIVKNQRSPSPSVAQLQEQIFVTKLGVAVDSQKISVSRRAGNPQKGPSSPSPQVKQLQQIIFSPEKVKDEQEERGSSPAAGWWKRIPNPPEVQPEQCESPAWKHETSSVCEEYADVSPSNTMMSEPPPRQKSWKKPQQGSINPGTPSWLRDVASFHSTSSPKLPSQPPVWQPAPEPSASGELDAQSSAPRASPVSQKLVDEEGSVEVMVMSSTTASTSRDDLSSQQEDTKSLIQMAADSVLIADYEQAMRRDIVESKSDEEEDESVANSTGNALPSELPLEFQQALTLEDQDEDKADEAAEPSSAQQHEVLPSPEEGKSSQHATATGASEEGRKDENPECSLDGNEHDSASPPSSPRGFSQPESPEYSQNESLGRQVSNQTEDVVFDEPFAFGDASGDALQDWAEDGLAPPPNEENQVDDTQPTEQVTQNDLSTSFCPSDTNLSGIEHDENGFPCAPLGEGMFGNDDFHADAFNGQQWTEGLGDEKKEDPSELLQYWAQNADAMNDSSEWADRDPGLDSIAMNSPEPLTVDKVIATAERVLKKWSASPPHVEVAPRNFSPQVEVAPRDFSPQVEVAPRDFSPQAEAAPRNLREPLPVPQAQGEGAWGSPQQPRQREDPNEGAWGSPQQPQQLEDPNLMHQEEKVMADPMWGAEQTIDATWGVSQADPFSASAGQFDMTATNEKPGGDVFDPFGDEEDETFNNFHTEKLFSEPTEAFVEVDSFSPPAFMPKQSLHQEFSLKPVSQEMENELESDLQMI